MICQNCGENEANFKYTKIVNGEKTEIELCDKCRKELGFGDISFNMPINFSSFLEDFFEEDPDIFEQFPNKNMLQCDKCGLKFEEFLNEGKFGCENCYEAFSEKIEPILKNIHGGEKHIGRIGKPKAKLEQAKSEDVVKFNKKIDKKENSKLEELQSKLKDAINEERYEDAAKLRDEIKKLK